MILNGRPLFSDEEKIEKTLENKTWKKHEGKLNILELLPTRDFEADCGNVTIMCSNRVLSV